MTKVTVKVTSDDIKRGKWGHPNRCPVSIALRRICQKGIRPSVGGKKVSFFLKRYDQDEPYTFSLPFRAQRFVSRFDQELNVTPLEFRLPDSPRIFRR